MKKKDVLNSPRLIELKKERRRNFRNKIFLCFFAIFLILACGASVFRIPGLNIKDVNISGNKMTDTEAIKSAVLKQITGNYLWFFPKANSLFYPKTDIEKALHAEFKGLKDIKSVVKEGKVLEISVTEREALYTWCGDDPLQNAGENPKCYYLDDSGYVFDEAPYFSGEVYFKFYGHSFSQFDFKKLISFKKELESAGLKPAALYAEENGDVKVFLSAGNSGGVGPEIIFKIDSDFQKVVENLQTALNTEPLLSGFKNKYSSLEYIDLRFGNKVYYKFR